MKHVLGRAAFWMLSLAAPANAQWIEWPVNEGGNGHYYRLTEVTGTWLEAQAEAEFYGGHLASISTLAENNWVFDHFGQQGNMWIGLYQDLSDPNYVEPDGGWRWANGESFGFENWDGDEPNNNGREHWVEMKGAFSVNAREWNDIGSQVPMRGVIEVAIFTEDVFFDGNQSISLGYISGGPCYGPAQEGLCFNLNPIHLQLFVSGGTCLLPDLAKMAFLVRYQQDVSGNWVKDICQFVNFTGSSGMCHLGDIAVSDAHLFFPLTSFLNGQNDPPDVLITRYSFDLVHQAHWAFQFPDGTANGGSDIAGVASAPGHLFAVQYQEPSESYSGAIFRFPRTADGVVGVSEGVRFPIVTNYANGIAIRGGYAYITHGELVHDADNPWGYIDVYALSHLSTSEIALPIRRLRFNVGFHSCAGFDNSHAQGLTIEGDRLWVSAVAGTEVRLLDIPLQQHTGDIDSDGVTDVDDLNYILGSWGESVGVGSDLDLAGLDGVVGVDDLNVVLSNWD